MSYDIDPVSEQMIRDLFKLLLDGKERTANEICLEMGIKVSRTQRLIDLATNSFPIYQTDERPAKYGLYIHDHDIDEYLENRRQRFIQEYREKSAKMDVLTFSDAYLN